MDHSLHSLVASFLMKKHIFKIDKFSNFRLLISRIFNAHFTSRESYSPICKNEFAAIVVFRTIFISVRVILLPK